MILPRQVLASLRYRAPSQLPLGSSVNYARRYSETRLEPITKIEKIILDNIKVRFLVTFHVSYLSLSLGKTTGPISFASYMQLCLSHPTEGYYQKPTNTIFGSRGDFITSPEISQVFGEVRSLLFMTKSFWR